MKGLRHLTLFIVFLALFQTLSAQCPPPGFPQPGNTCPQAPILCENLDGYCATINNNNISQTFPGCPGWVLNNDEWFAFYAGTTSITIQVTPSNCSPGAMMGLQGGIYSGCGPPWNAMDLQCSCTENPFILSSSNFVVGQIYWFVLDGCSGNVCDYSISVLDGSTVGAPPENPGPITGPTEACQGSSSGFSIPPALGATSYNWTLTPPGIGTVNGNGVNATVNLANNATGTAQLCVTASNQCYPNNTPACYTIDIIPKPTAMISGSGILCAGVPGTVDLTVSFTGQAPWEFIYTINGVPQTPIQTSDNPYTLQATQPGTYAIQGVTSVNGGCVGTFSGSASITETIINANAAVTNAQCGQSNGAINITPNGGNTPYTYNWSGGQTTEDISNIPAGTYTVTITDEDGCTKELTVDVPDDVVALNITGTVINNTTCIDGNGSIDISVAPAGTYTYNWSNGATTQDISNLPPGTYTVTVTAGVTCTGTADFTVGDAPNTPNINSNVTGSTCDLDNGSINLTVSGGVTPYTFTWSGGQTTEDLSNIPAGSYDVTVTGANGCTSTANINVPNNNPPITINGNVMANTTCNGGNGSISITATPPNPAYTYIWSNGATTTTLTNLPPGTYDVTVSAGGTCTQTASFTVPDQPNTPTINPNVTQSTCNLDNGSISLTVSGGVAPYTYNWSNGATTPNLTNIPAGSYDVTVTGANGCTSTASINVGNNNPPITVNANIVANTTCNGGNGSITLIVSPSNPNYTYIWSTGATTPNLSNLPPGTYDVTVSAGGTCTQTASFTVPDQPNTPVINPNPNQSTCGLNNGSITLTVTGGVTPYTYNWSTGATTPNLANIPAGTYDVTVTGANGCSSTASINVGNFNPQININGNVIANTSCNAAGNGSISITVTPVNTYTYQWSTGATTPNIGNLSPGTYIVTVSAGGACTQTAAFVVPDNPNAPILDFSFVEANCGLSNGSINLTVFGGVPPYTYQWSSGQTTQDLNNIPEGIYTVTVTGANGCSTVDGVVVPNDMIPISLDANVTNKTSCLINNGAISLILSPPGMSIMWSNGSTQPNLNNLAPGTYTVTVSAGGNCTETASFTVEDASEAPELFFDITPASCSLANGAVDLDVFTGIPPFTYKWSNGSFSQDLNNIPAGNYTVTVTSSVGCSTVATIGVPNNDLSIDILGTVADNISCTMPNGFIDIDVSPPGNYNYNWSNGKKTEDIENLTPGTYTVTVSLGSCIAVATFEVFDGATPPNLSVVAIPAICNQNNGGANATVSGGSSPYTFKWSNGATTEDISNVAPGTYTVTVTGFFGCSSTATVNIPNNNLALNINGTAMANTSCSAANGAVDITPTPAGTYSYTWSNAATTEDISGLAAGTYTVTVSAGGSCTATATFTVINNTTDPVIDPVVTAAICGASNGAIDLTITGATAPYTFNWSNAATTEDLANILSGNYSVTVTDANGCTADTTLNVANNSSTFSLSGTATPLTSCTADNGAVNLTVTPAGTYTYQWSNAAVTEDISNLPAGTYTVSVTETGNCTATASFIVANNLTYPAVTQNVSSEICGLMNGGVDITVTGGAMPYTYSWTGGATTEDLANVSAGAYTVTVTGTNGCSGTATANVPDNSVTFSIDGAPVPNTSCVGSNGSVDISLSPASPGLGLVYTYSWSNSAVTEDIQSVPAGNYTVTVSAGGTCTNTATFAVANNSQAPTIVENITPAFCGQNSGAVNLTIASGVSPFTFAWSNSAVTEDVSNLTSGNYSVTVTGANGCISSESYLVPENVVIPTITGAVTPNTSCVGSNGAISLNVAPALTYTFTWAGGQTVQDLSNIPAGAYSVTVSAGGGCTASTNFTVANNTAVIALSGTPTNILCFGNNTGAIDLTVNGGTQPYQYNWSPAVTGNPEDLANLVAGTYSVTVTDALGCSGATSFNVTQPAANLQMVCAQSKNVSFPGANDGAANLALSGGVPPYSVVWSPGGTQANVLPGNFAINSLGEGSYAVTVTDANGCIVICDFTISIINCETSVGTMSGTQQSLCGDGCLTAVYNSTGQFLDPNDVLQFILHEGSGNLIVNEIARNSQPTFCFDPTKMSYGTTYYISAVAGDNNGSGNVDIFHFCTVVSIGTPVVFREQPVAGIAPPDELNCIDKQVALVGSSDLPGSNFMWSTGTGAISGSTTQSTAIATASGSYTLIVSLNGCADTVSVVVDNVANQPTANILASPNDVLDCTISEIILDGQVEGSTSVNTIWIDNTGMVYPGYTVLQIDQPGSYTFVIIDTLSLCTDTASITINENLAYPPLFLDPPGFLTCINNTTTLTGGSPLPGIQFTWATINGTDTTLVGSGPSLNVTAPGTYYLIGIDPLNACTNALSEMVNADLAPPFADAGPSFSLDCFGETGYLDGNGSGGAAGLTFAWSTSNGTLVAGSNTPTPEINQPGTYVLVVTNPANGCTDDDQVVITPDEPVATLNVNQPPCYGDKGSIQVVDVAGGKPPIRYSIDDGQQFTTQNLFGNLSPGIYTILVVDAVGCSTTASAEVEEGDIVEIFLEPKAVIKLGESYQINTQVNIPASEIGSILWTPTTGLSCDTCLNPIATPPNSMVYRIRVANLEGCEDTAPILLAIDKNVNVYVPNVFSPDGDGENDVFTIYADPDGVKNIKSFQVFSRWGELIYEYYNFTPNNPAVGWDGRHRGKELNPAVFVWYAVLEFADGTEVLYKGDVTLKR
ncbi:MAG: gliding motility-associated C-terminal domain-containing protein [Saprospiraceae bacterium]|nr:gliding motility-associated C-terminal domain-containing protein [Saprospiraceae bacterium]